MKIANAKLYTAIGVVVVAFFTFLLFNVNSAQAAILPTQQKTLAITLLGDSYSAGNGAGSYYSEPDSYRSYNNWAHRYTDWLNKQGVKTTLNNLAYSGYKTENIIKKEQVDKIPENTDLAMLTIGGNDANFGGIVQNCLSIFRNGNACRDLIVAADAGLGGVMTRTKEIFEKLEGRLRSDAKIVLVGYPLLSMESDYELSRCSYYTLSGYCMLYDKYNAAQAVRELGRKANQKQAELVAKWNANHDLKVTYIDNISDIFAGHEPNPFATSRNPQRWLNEFLETEGKVDDNGNINSKFSSNINEWYHPNITGHQKIANQIISTIGIPSSTRTITPDNSDIDVAFVVETTGSVVMSLPQIKQEIKRSILQYQIQARTIRFALVDYRNHPDNFVTRDYAAKVQSDFTYDVDKFDMAIDQLKASDDGVPGSASFHSGAAAAMDLNWRYGVRKLMVVIGNLPAQDPEPITGYTWQTVRQKAYALDPVEVYSIDTQGSLLSSSIEGLVDGTGGQSFPNSQDVFSSAMSVFYHSTDKPFGWIQGPYVVKVGGSLALDARASYAVLGNIKKVDWDLDGNGTFETNYNSLLYTHTFSQEYSGTIGVRITDTNGQTGIGSTHIDVTDDGDSTPRSVDNCPDIANQNQADFDKDGIGDDCDDYVDYGSLLTDGDNTDDKPSDEKPDAKVETEAKSTPLVKTESSITKVMPSKPVLATESDEDSNFKLETDDSFDIFGKTSTASAPLSTSGGSVYENSQPTSRSWLDVISIAVGSIALCLAIVIVIRKSKKPINQ